jgi:hypothetical protein
VAAADKTPAEQNAPTPGELAAAQRRKAAAQQRSRWLEQYLGEGWTELEPGIFNFSGTVDPKKNQ